MQHPFGYGMERYFWSLLAAVGIFVSGAVFSIYQGVHGLLSGESEVAGYLLSYAVLLVSFVAEGASWLKAVRQLRGEARAAERGMVAAEVAAWERAVSDGQPVAEYQADAEMLERMRTAPARTAQPLPTCKKSGL